MQTFLTSTARTEFNAVAETAAILDSKRLGKQRLEGVQIYRALTTGRGFINHPATKMWAGFEDSLIFYIQAMSAEWVSRGNDGRLIEQWVKTKLKEVMSDPERQVITWPWWFSNNEMVATHRAKLLRKDTDHYMGLFDQLWDDDLPIEFNLPYLWPMPNVQGAWYISAAEMKRSDEWEVPSNWHVSAQGAVTFGGVKK